MNISYIVNQLFNVSGRNKNVRIAEIKDQSVAASGNVTVINDFSLADYPYHYIVVNSDSKHNFRVNEQYKTDGLSIPYPAQTIVDYSVNSGRRNATDWIKAKGETVHIDIENLDTENAHTYSVYVIGVR